MNFLTLEDVDGAIYENQSFYIHKFDLRFLQDKEEFESLFVTKNKVDPDKCIGCRLCLKAGCPAMYYVKEDKKVVINRAACVGCDVCTQVCPKNAIGKED